jgi:hypothetical protein
VAIALMLRSSRDRLRASPSHLSRLLFLSLSA